MGALVEPKLCRPGLMQHALAEHPHPGSGRIDQRASARNVPPASSLQDDPPDIAPLRANAARAGADHGAAFGRIDGIEHNQASIVGLAVGIFEPAAISGLQWGAESIVRKVDGAGRRQDSSPAEVVVNEQAAAQDPEWTRSRLVRQDEAYR